MTYEQGVRIACHYVVVFMLIALNLAGALRFYRCGPALRRFFGVPGSREP